MIDTVTPASPAGRAGLAPGDVVVQVGGTDVRSMDDIQDLMPSYRPDQQVTMTLLRKGTRLTLTVTLGYRPEA